MADFEKIKSGAAKIAIYFTATWSDPCKFIEPVFAKMADDFSDIMFVQIDAYAAAKVSAHYNVEAVPSFVFLKDGDEIGRLVQPVGLSGLKEALDKLKALQGMKTYEADIAS